METTSDCLTEDASKRLTEAASEEQRRDADADAGACPRTVMPTSENLAEIRRVVVARVQDQSGAGVATETDHREFESWRRDMIGKLSLGLVD